MVRQQSNLSKRQSGRLMGSRSDSPKRNDERHCLHTPAAVLNGTATDHRTRYLSMKLTTIMYIWRSATGCERSPQFHSEAAVKKRGLALALVAAFGRTATVLPTTASARPSMPPYAISSASSSSIGRYAQCTRVDAANWSLVGLRPCVEGASAQLRLAWYVVSRKLSAREGQVGMR